MKIGYKIILGSLLLGASFNPGNKVLNRYKEFKNKICSFKRRV